MRQESDISKLENHYTQRDLIMILLGAKISAEIFANEYDDDRICDVVLTDLITESGEAEYEPQNLLNILNKNLYQ